MKRFLVSLALTSTALAATPPITADGFVFVKEVGGIQEFRLESNGLRVLIVPQPGMPTATFMVTYHVGSRNEVTGTTGSTHLLEHLMFKGTPKHHRGLGTSFDQVLERVGALTNATTWLDRTNYYATVPVNALPLLIELEADRMRNLSLLDEDRRPEMTVVRNEFELGENNPMDALQKEIWAAAFQAHPYHHDTIGWRSDIENVPTAKLREFYDTFYWPNNATCTVIGGFDPKHTLEMIRAHYGVIPKASHEFPKLYTVEPEQTGQRRVQVKRAGELGVVMMAHKTPAATHADWPAIEVFSRILAHGDTSRCFRELTDKNLTIEVDGWASFTHDPSLHMITAELADDAKPADVEAALVEQIELIKVKGVTADEVKTAIAGFLSQRAFSRDGSYALANEINECIAVGDWTLYTTLEDKIKAVTPAEVQRVAKTYFTEAHSTVGWFLPQAASGQTETTSGKQETFEPKTVVPPAPLKQKLEAPAKTDLAKRVHRESIAGADVLVCPTAARDIVSLRISLPVGEALDKNHALSHLAFDMTERGTTKRDKFAIAETLESAGVDLESKVSSATVETSVKCLAADLPMVLEVLVEQWRTPAFDKDEFAKAKKDFISSQQQSLENTEEQAIIAFSRALRVESDPLRRSTVAELVSDAKRATLADVKAFHSAHYGPKGLRIVAVGDVDAAKIGAQLKKLLDGWKTQSSPVRSSAPFAKSNAKVDVPMADKSSVTVVFGQGVPLKAGDPGWLALRLANDALGMGFTSRLIGNVRDREGLTYSIGSRLADDHDDPMVWSVLGNFAPAMLDQGLASTRREIEHWWKDGITAEELEYRKSSIAGEYVVHLETTQGLAEQILACVKRGFDLSWLDDYPAKLDALTLQEVNEAVRQQLAPQDLITVRAGVSK